MLVFTLIKLYEHRINPRFFLNIKIVKGANLVISYPAFSVNEKLFQYYSYTIKIILVIRTVRIICSQIYINIIF